MNGPTPFVFYTERRLVVLTGRRARNLLELLDGLGNVSGSSIFYHTHHQFLSLHFEKPVFYNDFANWVGRALQLEKLAEKLASVDLLGCTSVRQVRESIIAGVEEYAATPTFAARDCPAGDEFHFCESQSFVMRTGIVAEDVKDFFSKVGRVSNVSLFFHFFEARLRLERPTNDFSLWLRDLGEVELAGKIDRLDPYAMTLDELRDEIMRMGKVREAA